MAEPDGGHDIPVKGSVPVREEIVRRLGDMLSRNSLICIKLKHTGVVTLRRLQDICSYAVL